MQTIPIFSKLFDDDVQFIGQARRAKRKIRRAHPKFLAGSPGKANLRRKRASNRAKPVLRRVRWHLNLPWKTELNEINRS